MAEADKTPDDPLAPLKKQLLTWRVLAILSILIGVLALVGAVATTGYAVSQSMVAFNDLPTYRVNKLVNDYAAAVAKLDTSHAATLELVQGEAGQIVLRDALTLAQTVLAAEQQFHADIGEYGGAIDTEVEQIGGALEWNRHFQAQLAGLRESSERRQVVLQAIVTKYPKPDLPAEPASGDGAEKTKPNEDDSA